MLRVGLTGELGSGKSTVARLLAAHGAIVLSSDEMGRAMMQPGERVYQAIIDHFGPEIVLPDGRLDRPGLARLAFDPEHPRVEELNAIVHPAVLAEQGRQLDHLAQTQPDAIAIIESALLFTTKHAGTEGPWRSRFDAVVLVTAPDALKVQRYVQRVAAGRTLPAEEERTLQDEARSRLAAQRIPSEAQHGCLILKNDGSPAALEDEAKELMKTLQRLAQAPPRTESR